MPCLDLTPKWCRQLREGEVRDRQAVGVEVGCLGRKLRRELRREEVAILDGLRFFPSETSW